MRWTLISQFPGPVQDFVQLLYEVMYAWRIRLANRYKRPLINVGLSPTRPTKDDFGDGLEGTHGLPYTHRACHNHPE